MAFNQLLIFYAADISTERFGLRWAKKNFFFK